MSSISGPEHLSGHHRDTLLQIFQKKTNHNVEWHDVVSLLAEVGSIEEQQQQMRDIVMRELGDSLRNGVLRAGRGEVDAAQAAP